MEALESALNESRPEIFNTDLGSQFTSKTFIGRLEQEDIKVSMDGKGRVFDNIFIERLWRTLKYEEIYLNDYKTVLEAEIGIRDYFHLYNYERLHQSLNYETPANIHFKKGLVFTK